MLAYWHYGNKGSEPFKKALTVQGLKELQTEADLTEEQAEFIGRTAREIRKRGIHALHSVKNEGANGGFRSRDKESTKLERVRP
jgi:hypothetical protein